MKFRVASKTTLPSNILLVISYLKILIFNICRYVFCPGCIIVQQRTHSRNFIHFTFFFSSSFPSYSPLLNRSNNILQGLEIIILQRESRYICAHKTNRFSSVKQNHFLFCNKFIICLYMFRALYAPHQEVKIVLYSLWYHHTCRWPSSA